MVWRLALGTLGGLLFGLSGCLDPSSTGSPTGIRILLTDAPGCFDEVWARINEVAVHRSGGSWFVVPLTTSNVDAHGDGVDDVVVHPVGTVSVNLIAPGGVEVLFASGELGPGHYTRLRLRVQEAWGMDGGTTVPLDVPSGAQTGVKTGGELTVDPGQVATLLLDFDAQKSVSMRKDSVQPPLLKPVIQAVVTEAPGGSLWAWGWNQDGQPGDGSHYDRNFAREVGGGASGSLVGATAIRGGGAHSLAVIPQSVRGPLPREAG